MQLIGRAFVSHIVYAWRRLALRSKAIQLTRVFAPSKVNL